MLGPNSIKRQINPLFTACPSLDLYNTDFLHTRSFLSCQNILNVLPPYDIAVAFEDYTVTVSARHIYPRKQCQYNMRINDMTVNYKKNNS